MLLALPLLPLLLGASGAPVPYPNLGALLDKAGTELERQVKRTQDDMKTVRVRKEELDSDGRVKHVEEELLRAQGTGASLEMELVHATEDGKDVTADRLAKRAKWEAGHPGHKAGEAHHHGEHGLTDVNPFAARAKYRYWVVAPLPPAGQPVEIHFEPNGEKSKDLMTGDAWVDPSTGDVRSIVFAPSDLPMMVQALKVRAELGSGGEAPAARELQVEGEAGLLFWHKRFRVHLWFDPKQS